MFAKLRNFLKKALLFTIVSGFSFFVLVMIVGSSDLMYRDDFVGFVSTFLPVVLPIVLGVMAVCITNRKGMQTNEISKTPVESVPSLEADNSAEDITESTAFEETPPIQDEQQREFFPQINTSDVSSSTTIQAAVTQPCITEFQHLSTSTEDSSESEAATTEEIIETIDAKPQPAVQEEPIKENHVGEHELVLLDAPATPDAAEETDDYSGIFDDSTLTVIKEELSRLNWQLIVGGLIFCNGLLKLFSNFFFAIVLVVLGLGILSIGVTKYKEKQELQERELKRKIMAAVAKESPSKEKTEPAPTPKPAATQTSRANTKCKTYKVAGVTHYVENIKSLGIENDDYSKSKRELIAEDMIDERIWKYEFYSRSALLQPEPDNPVDPNAIKVIVDGEHVGYIKSGSSSHVHKLINNHAIADVICTIGGGPYKCVSEEYDDEKDEDVYILEKGEINFFVHLEIYEKVDAPY